ncbi:MAG TPA: penicillin acylase family protein, partial [Rhodothermales bacterium]
MIRRFVTLVALILITLGLLYVLANQTRFIYSLRGMQGFVPAMGTLLDPLDGLWRTARGSVYRSAARVVPGLKGEARIVRDDRGVPHIFAAEDRDAVAAMGYAVARDRLFQLDFIPRAASGRLSEVFGPNLLSTDRYMRSTGMEWSARINLARIQSENDVEHDL